MSLALPAASVTGSGAPAATATFLAVVLFYLLIGAMFLSSRAKTADGIPVGFVGGVRVMAVTTLLLVATAVGLQFASDVAPLDIVIW